MNDFLTFRRMVTPVIIQFLFWIGVLACIVTGISFLLSGGGHYYSGATRLFGLLVLLGGPLAVRVYCEILIVIFRINETLTDMKDLLGKK